MKHGKIHILSAVALSAAGAFALPRAENVTFSEDANDVVTITYTLSETPAIVTLDIETNATDGTWASIGGAAVVGGTSAGSAVWRKVTTADADGSDKCTITWTPNRAWANHNQTAGKTRAVVTAWAPANPPDYMAVDITKTAQPNTQRYYPSADFVPGGVLGDKSYRVTSLLMRRIPARNRTFTMGSFSESERNAGMEATHLVTLTNDFYMGVFEVTQSQWALIKGNWPSYWANTTYRAMRPVEKVSYNDVRVAANNVYAAAHDFPNAPGEGTFLDLLNKRTGLAFDLPGEAQWEFACRAGTGEGQWNDGTSYDYVGTKANCKRVGRTTANVASSGTGPDAGTAICGSYAPSLWGLYDMHGNISEWCLDWHVDAVDIDYHVNVDPSDPSKYYNGTTVTDTRKNRRGGSYAHGLPYARSAARNRDFTTTRWEAIGFRVVCPVEMP